MFQYNSKINPDKNKTSKRKPLPESNLGKRENNTANIHVGKGPEIGQNASTPLPPLPPLPTLPPLPPPAPAPAKG